MDRTKEQVGVYADVEVEGIVYKVRKITPRDEEGSLIAPSGFIDKDGKQIVCSENSIDQVLEDFSHLKELLGIKSTDK
jgi:hypothetical protein